jgi:hypothetical protein
MDRTPLYAQFDGDDVDGKRYELGEELSTDTDPGTVAYLTTNGRFAAVKPGDEDAHSYDTSTPTADMGRLALLAELGAGQSDETLREAVERKREHDAEEAEADRKRVAEAEQNDPLSGNLTKATDYIATVTDPAELATLKDRETNGAGRKGVFEAIEKRAEAIKTAG